MLAMVGRCAAYSVHTVETSPKTTDADQPFTHRGPSTPPPTPEARIVGRPSSNSAAQLGDDSEEVVGPPRIVTIRILFGSFTALNNECKDSSRPIPARHYHRILHGPLTNGGEEVIRAIPEIWVADTS